MVLETWPTAKRGRRTMAKTGKRRRSLLLRNVSNSRRSRTEQSIDPVHILHFKKYIDILFVETSIFYIVASSSLRNRVMGFLPLGVAVVM